MRRSWQTKRRGRPPRIGPIAQGMRNDYDCSTARARPGRHHRRRHHRRIDAVPPREGGRAGLCAARARPVRERHHVACGGPDDAHPRFPRPVQARPVHLRPISVARGRDRPGDGLPREWGPVHRDEPHPSRTPEAPGVGVEAHGRSGRRADAARGQGAVAPAVRRRRARRGVHPWQRPGQSSGCRDGADQRGAPVRRERIRAHAGRGCPRARRPGDRRAHRARRYRLRSGIARRRPVEPQVREAPRGGAAAACR